MLEKTHRIGRRALWVHHEIQLEAIVSGPLLIGRDEGNHLVEQRFVLRVKKCFRIATAGLRITFVRRPIRVSNKNPAFGRVPINAKRTFCATFNSRIRPVADILGLAASSSSVSS